MKVEIEFPGEFVSNKPLYIQLGRLILGGHIGRIAFSPEGKLVMVINRKAVEDGAIILCDSPDSIYFL